MQVCNLTTPAQYFHVLRRQMMRSFRKPLIIMTPKSLLRSKEAASSLRDMTDMGFQEVIDDPREPLEARTAILCSGKIYYDLNRKRLELDREDIAIIRIEQLYPLPETQLRERITRYTGLERFLWVQEEPRNRGSWYFINEHRQRIVGDAHIEYVGRKGSASPATGSYKQHSMELDHILDQAFGKP